MFVQFIIIFFFLCKDKTDTYVYVYISEIVDTVIFCTTNIKISTMRNILFFVITHFEKI